jgi:hypothetical protein
MLPSSIEFTINQVIGGLYVWIYNKRFIKREFSESSRAISTGHLLDIVKIFQIVRYMYEFKQV